MRSIKISLLAVVAAWLLAVPALAADTGGTKHHKGGYTSRVHIQMSGGMNGPLYKSEPIIISFRGRGHGDEHYTLTMTPAPVGHAASYAHRRVNGPGVSTEPTKAGKLKLRFKLSTGRVITRTLRVRG